MKKKITITVCDVCREDGMATKPYRLAAPDERLRTVDLCSQHARPMAKLLKDIAQAKA